MTRHVIRLDPGSALHRCLSLRFGALLALIAGSILIFSTGPITNAASPAAGLVLWNKLGSETEVLNSAFGPNLRLPALRLATPKHAWRARRLAAPCSMAATACKRRRKLRSLHVFSNASTYVVRRSRMRDQYATTNDSVRCGIPTADSPMISCIPAFQILLGFADCVLVISHSSLIAESSRLMRSAHAIGVQAGSATL